MCCVIDVMMIHVISYCMVLGLWMVRREYFHSYFGDLGFTKVLSFSSVRYQSESSRKYIDFREARLLIYGAGWF